MHPTPAPLLFALTLVAASSACERSSAPTTSPSPAASDPSEPSEPETAAAPTQTVPQLVLPDIPAEPPTRTPEQVRTLHQQYRQQLAEARRLRDDSELDAASRAYLGLLDIDPTDTLVLRELAGVAERLGDFAGAEAALARALRFTREQAGQLELHGELARLLAAAGAPERAREHLRESLLLAESPAVRAELNRFGEAFVTLDQACEYLYRDLECERDPCDMSDAFDHCTLPENRELGGMFAFNEIDAAERVYAAVKTSIGWTLYGEIAILPNHGVNGILVELDERREFIHRHGGHTYIGVEIEYTIRDLDMGIETVSYDMTKDVVLCRAEGPAALCAMIHIDADSCTGAEFDKPTCSETLFGYRIAGDEVIIRPGKKETRKTIEAELAPTSGFMREE